jgi:hypothetical protein
VHRKSGKKRRVECLRVCRGTVKAGERGGNDISACAEPLYKPYRSLEVEEHQMSPLYHKVNVYAHHMRSLSSKKSHKHKSNSQYVADPVKLRVLRLKILPVHVKSAHVRPIGKLAQEVHEHHHDLPIVPP